MDDDGMAVVLIENLPRALEPLAEEAVYSCPEGAILIAH
jgi:ferredoxin